MRITEIRFPIIEQLHKNVRIIDYLQSDTFELIHVYYLNASTGVTET
jgi:hypothetical protein